MDSHMLLTVGSLRVARQHLVCIVLFNKSTREAHKIICGL